MASLATRPASVEAFRVAEFELVTAYESRVGPGANRRDLIDTCFSTWYILRGSVALGWRGGGVDAGPGGWVFADPFRRRSQRFTPGATIVSIRFQAPGLVPRCAALDGLPAVLRGRPRLLDDTRALVAAVAEGSHEDLHGWRRSPRGFEDCCAVQAAFATWLAGWAATLRAAGLLRDPAALADRRLRAALRILEADETLGPVPYDELAAASGLSRAHLDRLWLREFGFTPRRFRERRCLAAAGRLLRADELSVKEIAARLAFADSSHFAKWFRRQTGFAPLAFRRRALGA